MYIHLSTVSLIKEEGRWRGDVVGVVFLFCFVLFWFALFVCFSWRGSTAKWVVYLSEEKLCG